MYNVRNSLNDDKTREKLTAEACDGYLEKAKVYLDWLEANPTGTKEEYEEQKKAAEADFQPFFMKLYGTGDSAEDSSDAAPAPGPKIEEVD